MLVNVRFIGPLRYAAGIKEMMINCNLDFTIRELCNEIVRKIPVMREILFDSKIENPKLKALTLVNGKEISVLNGLKTQLKNRDKVVFIPVVHGG